MAIYIGSVPEFQAINKYKIGVSTVSVSNLISQYSRALPNFSIYEWIYCSNPRLIEKLCKKEFESFEGEYYKLDSLRSAKGRIRQLIKQHLNEGTDEEDINWNEIIDEYLENNYVLTGDSSKYTPQYMLLDDVFAMLKETKKMNNLDESDILYRVRQVFNGLNPTSQMFYDEMLYVFKGLVKSQGDITVEDDEPTGDDSSKFKTLFDFTWDSRDVLTSREVIEYCRDRGLVMSSNQIKSIMMSLGATYTRNAVRKGKTRTYERGYSKVKFRLDRDTETIVCDFINKRYTLSGKPDDKLYCHEVFNDWLNYIKNDHLSDHVEKRDIAYLIRKIFKIELIKRQYQGETITEFLGLMKKSHK